MKRLMILLLALLASITASACSDGEEGPALSGPVTVIVTGQSVTLSEEDSAVVTGILAGSGWINEQYKCEPDVKVSSNGHTYYYHSTCGSFTDRAGSRGLVVSDETQEQLNAIFSSYVTLGGILFE